MEVTYKYSYLPAGNVNSDYNITCLSLVYDVLGAYSTATTKVQVAPVSTSAGVDSLLREQVSGAGDVDSTKQVLSLASTILNQNGYTFSNMSAKVALRHSLLTSLYDLTAMDDETAVNVATWNDHLAALTQNVSELRSNSVSINQNIASKVLLGAASLDVPYSTISTVLDAMSNTAQVASDNSYIGELAGKYGALVSQQLYAGQASVSTVHDSFRVAVAAFSPSDQPQKLSMPLTSSETAANKASSSVSITSNADATSAVKMSAVTIKPSSGQYNSPALKITVSGMDSIAASSGERRRLSDSSGAYITVVLQNDIPVNTSSQVYSSSYTAVTTCAMNQVSQSTYTCPDTGYEVTHTCSSKSYDYNVTSSCPDYTIENRCKALDMATQELDGDACTLLDYTEYNITCSCFISSDASYSGKTTIVAVS